MASRKLILLIALFVAVPLFSFTAKGGNSGDGGGWLGIYTQTIDSDLKEAFDLDSDNGVVIIDVVDDSPAEKAGLNRGDIITMVDGEVMTSSDDLVKAIRGYEPGDQTKVFIFRDGKKKAFDVILGNSDDMNIEKEIIIQKFGGKNSRAPKAFTKSYFWTDEKVSDVYIGVNLDDLNAQLGEYFGVVDGNGILITEVMDESPAKRANLKAGDVISAVNGEDVNSPSDVVEKIGELKEGDEVELAILRDKSKKTIKVTLEKRPDDYYSFRGKDVDFFDHSDIDIMPRMKGLFYGDAFHKYHDQLSDDDAGSIEELEKEIDLLKSQVKELMEKFKNLE